MPARPRRGYASSAAICRSSSARSIKLSSTPCPPRLHDGTLRNSGVMQTRCRGNVTSHAGLDKHAELHKKTLEELLRGINTIPEDIRTAVRNNAGGHHNHSLFWTIMAPAGKGGGGEPAGALADAIKKTFGDFTKFKEQIA